jgi:DNA polymerase-3 subunit alpha
MQIAQVLAGYSLGGADLLRRAMGKKKPEEMAKQRGHLRRGRGSPRRRREAKAAHIFDLMEKFAGYGFNKSHAAAYALVAYQTAWLKAHYPADKVVTLIEECRTMGLKVEPPTINRSEYRFTIADAGTVVYGLGAIKGVGESAIETILEARRSGGPFRDIWELCRRIDLHKANRRVLEALIRAGALDGLAPNRATLMAQLAPALKLAEQHRETQAAGQGDLFGDLCPAGEAAARPDPQIAAEVRDDWDDEQRLAGERETLGLYLTGHPIDRYAAEIDAMVGPTNRIARLQETERPDPESGGRWKDRERRTVAGLVVSVRHGKTQRGRMGSAVLDDRTGRIEIAVFSELYEQARNLLIPDQMLAVAGSLNFDEFRNAWTLRADDVRTFEQARESQAEHLALILDLADPARHGHGTALVERLRAILEPFRGGDLRILLDYRRPGARGRLLCGDSWRVQPRDTLLKQLRRLLGNDAVEVSYRRGPLTAEPERPRAPRLAVVR